MRSETVSLLSYFIFLKLTGVCGVKATLQAIPNIVLKGSHTVLQCDYIDLKGAPLYKVSWYRGPRHEFYRFETNQTPQKRSFEVLGIYVDLTYSNATQVTLRNMDFVSSGRFSCEVSMDGPSFATSRSATFIEVVSPPVDGPVISVNDTRYSPGDVLSVNCTSSASKPAVNLTLLINNQKMTGARKVYYDVEDGYKTSEVIVRETLSDSHFKSGKLVVRCTAEMRSVYNKQTMKILRQANDPKPERITSPADSGTSVVSANKIWMAVLLLALLFSSALLQDYGEYYNAVEEVVFNDLDYEVIPPDIKAALLQ